MRFCGRWPRAASAGSPDTAPRSPRSSRFCAGSARRCWKTTGRSKTRSRRETGSRFRRCSPTIPMSTQRTRVSASCSPSAFVEQLLPVSSLGVAGLALHLHSVPKDQRRARRRVELSRERRRRCRVDRSLCATRRRTGISSRCRGPAEAAARTLAAADIRDRTRDRRAFARLSDRRRALLGAVGTSASGPRPAPAGVQSVYGTARGEAHQNTQHDCAEQPARRPVHRRLSPGGRHVEPDRGCFGHADRPGIPDGALPRA